MNAKAIHIAQFRLSGPTQGFRVLRQITGEHVWRLRLWLKFPDGGDAERDIFVREPVPLLALVPIYEREIYELCNTQNGSDVIVKSGGCDVYLLPTQATPPRRACAV